ncbi:hypothetical protein Gotur_019863, partial [Gossypium turneri]
MFQQEVPLAIEFSLCVVLKWLLDRSYKPWMLRSLCIGIDSGINQLLRVQLIIILRQANCMDNALAKTGIRRSSLFKAWWSLWKLYVKKGKNDRCRTKAVVVAIDGHFADSKSCLLAGWLAEERRVPSGRLYR